MAGNKIEEAGLIGLTASSPSFAEQIEELQMQLRIMRTMSDVVHDHRGGNIHAQSSSIVPREPLPAPEPIKSQNGWIDPVPLEQSHHVRNVDRIAEAFAAREAKDRARNNDG